MIQCSVSSYHDVNAGQQLLAGEEGKLTPTLVYLKYTLDYLKQ